MIKKNVEKERNRYKTKTTGASLVIYFYLKMSFYLKNGQETHSAACASVYYGHGFLYPLKVLLDIAELMYNLGQRKQALIRLCGCACRSGTSMSTTCGKELYTWHISFHSFDKKCKGALFHNHHHDHYHHHHHHHSHHHLTWDNY